MWLHVREQEMCFATTARVEGSFSEAQLREALAKAARRHPLLAARVVIDEEGQPSFVAPDVLELPLRVIEEGEERGWTQVVREELGRRFLWETGLARFAWLRSAGFSDLIGVYHHAIADGLSGAYLVRDILHYLGNPEAPVERLPVLPGVDELVPQAGESGPEVSFSETVAHLPRPDQERDAPAGPPAFWLRAWALTPPQTSAVVARAREEGTTVHGTLGAAFLLSFAEILGGSQVRTIQSPVNLRGRLSQPVGEGLGNFTTLIKASVDCAPGRDLWETARDVRAGLQRELEPERLFTIFNLMRAARSSPPGSRAFLENVDKAAAFFRELDYDLSLSNLGRLDFPSTYGLLRLESLYGPTFSAMEGDRIAGVTTFGGRMHFTFIFREPAMAAAAAEQICQLAMDRLGEATSW